MIVKGRKDERPRKIDIVWLVFLILGLVFMFVFGQSPNALWKPHYCVQCSLEQKFLGIFHVSAKSFLDVNDAWVETIVMTWLLIPVGLLTSDGQQPMTNYYSSLKWQGGYAWEINSYIQRKGMPRCSWLRRVGYSPAVFDCFCFGWSYQMIVKGLLQPKGWSALLLLVVSKKLSCIINLSSSLLLFLWVRSSS